MICGCHTVKVSVATRMKHWRICPGRTRTCIPYFFWSDGRSTICNRWYWFKNAGRIGAGYSVIKMNFGYRTVKASTTKE